MSTSPVPVPPLPEAATTTIPLNQSFSTALSSGSDWKLVCVSPTIDRLTTRMSYCALCARIQSMPAITSLASDSPFRIRRADVDEVRVRRGARMEHGRACRDSCDHRSVPLLVARRTG